MKILSIGIYHAGTPEFLLSHPTYHGTSSLREMENLSREYVNTVNPTESHFYIVRRERVNYYIKSTGEHLFLFASLNDIDADELPQLFFTMTHFAQSRQYNDLARLLENPSHRPQASPPPQESIEEQTRRIYLAQIEHTLRQGEPIDALLEKTRLLADTPCTFKMPASRKSSSSWLRKIASCFCFFPCLQTKPRQPDPPGRHPARRVRIN